MIENESKAVTPACKKFDFYSVDTDFEMETDHKPLVPFLSEKNLLTLPLQVQRLKLRFMRYSSKMFHTPGSSMHIADLLGRPNIGTTCDRDIKQGSLVELYVESIITVD